jgi:peptidoglycan/LPS O-acetylase OafA/YrhL
MRRGCGIAALAGAAAFLALLGAVVAAGLEPDDAFSDLRVHWAPLGLAAIEGPLAVGASVWLLGTAQRHLDRPPGRGGRALARSAYAAFILQGPVLIGVALALRPIDMPAEIKAFAVACGGVAISFALAWVLVARTRLARIL